MFILLSLHRAISYASKEMHFLFKRSEMVFEFAHMLTNLLIMGLKQSQASTGCRITLSSQVGIYSHLANRHPGCTQPQQKSNPLKVIHCITAMAACCPPHRRKQSCALVIPQCMGTQASTCHNILNSECSSHASSIKARVRSKSRGGTSVGTKKETCAPKKMVPVEKKQGIRLYR